MLCNANSKMNVLVSSAIVVLLTVTVSFMYACWDTPISVNVKRDVMDEYDYVIVGAGSAGSVLATRLSEDGHTQVLLLETGDNLEKTPLFYEPLNWAFLLNTSYDWGYITVPQTHSCLGMVNQQCLWPRGKVVGGSSSIGVMYYTRGSPFDFDEWEANGCKGWGFKDVLPYFKKSEDMTIEEFKSSKYHSVGGPIAVTTADITPLAKMYRRAMSELGFEEQDYNGADQVGVNKAQYNTRKGQRSMPGTEMLMNIRKDNLHVSVNSHVVKINFDGNRAKGVTYIRDNKKRVVKARKEIVLSAGAINSPQLLMLSGIGPKVHLSELGIPVIADLPVGENLQDHEFLVLCVPINKPFSFTHSFRYSLSSAVQYNLFGTGPRSATGIEGSAFVHLQPKNRGKTYPDIQFIFYSGFLGKTLFNFRDDIANKMIIEDPESHGFCTLVTLTHPRARGHIKLASTDPFDYPTIDPRYFHDPRDVADMVAGIRVYEKLMETPTIKELGVDLKYLKKTFCSQHEFRSDQYWECFVRHTAISEFHSTSTCKMGPIEQTSTVVGPDLKVKGVQGLRVVDASIFPNVTSGNTNAPVVMVAEKAADLIRNIDSVKYYR